MPQVSDSLRLRLELKALRDQVRRMAEAHKAKGALEFEAAWFAASMRITELERLLNDLG